MSDDLVSVLIAVYNTEEYLQRCVASIVNQSYYLIEIIIVNDGSTDNSATICEQLSEEDNRIKVIHQPNGGLSAARNTGIDNASGNYIVFIDSDDYVERDHIRNLYNLVTENEADISITDYIMEFENTGKRRKKKILTNKAIIMDREEAIEDFLYQKHFTTAIWGRLFKRTLFDDVSFPLGRTAQDVGVMYKLIDKANKVVFQSIPDYIYVQRDTSTVYSRINDRERDSLSLSEEMRSFIILKYPGLESAVISRCFSINTLALMRFPFKELYNENHSAVRSNIKKYRSSVLKDSKARLRNRGCALLSYFGLWVLKLLVYMLSLRRRAYS